MVGREQPANSFDQLIPGAPRHQPLIRARHRSLPGQEEQRIALSEFAQRPLGRLRIQAAGPDGLAQLDRTQARQSLFQHVGGAAAEQALQVVQDGPVESPVTLRGMGVRHHPPAQSGAGRGSSQDVVIAAPGDDGFFQLQLKPSLVARAQLLGAQQTHPRPALCRAQEQLGGLVVADPLRCIGQQAETHVQAGGRLLAVGLHQDVATPDLAHFDSREVGGHPAPDDGRLNRGLVGLQAAHPGPLAPRQDLHLLAHFERSVHQGAGDHRAETGYAEGPVDRQSRPSEIRSGGGGRQHLLQGMLEVLQTLPGGRRNRHNR